MRYLSSVRVQLRHIVSKFIKNERGVTAIEYAVVAAGISAILLFIYTTDDGIIYNMFDHVFRGLKYGLVSIIRQ